MRRLTEALEVLEHRLRARDDVVGAIVFGSYARGEFGRASDVDLLVLLGGEASAEQDDAGRAIPRLVGEIETELRLPMHLAPLLASVGHVGHMEDLGPDLLHDLWRDGVVLYAEAAALALLQPRGLSPWTLFRFSAAKAAPNERVRLSRRLHGLSGRPGLIRPPALRLGRGALLVPASLEQAVRAALDEAGAVYDPIPVWREA